MIATNGKNKSCFPAFYYILSFLDIFQNSLGVEKNSRCDDCDGPRTTTDTDTASVFGVDRYRDFNPCT